MKTPNAAKQKAFLRAYAECASITEAAEEAGIGRDAHYAWLESDPSYLKRFEAAGDKFGDRVVAEMKKRALDGWMEPVIYHGQRCFEGREVEVPQEDGTIKKVTVFDVPLRVLKKSERLLEKLADAFKPGLFAQRRQIELTGKDGGPIEVSLADVLRGRREKREQQQA